MASIQLNALLFEKCEDERIEIARRACEKLTIENLTDAERLAAEAVVRQLAEDSIERVRQALSHAVKHAKFLARDIAFTIAHDIDSVACPFLEVTEVFTDDEWRELVLTITRGALIAVARRHSMSEGLALAISEVGDSIAAEALIDNRSAPMTTPVCLSLIEHFESTTWVLDKLAEHPDLGADIAVKLINKVSDAAFKKLSALHNLDNHIAPIIVEAENLSIIRLVHETSESLYPDIVRSLQKNGKLTCYFYTLALSKGPIAFFEAILSTLSGVRIEKVRSIVRKEKVESLTKLLLKIRIPSREHGQFLKMIQKARQNMNAPVNLDISLP